MSDKKYSDEDVKRIVQEALKQQKEDQKIIDEALNEYDQPEEMSQGEIEQKVGRLPDHWNSGRDNQSSNKYVEVKDKNISEMRTGCGIIILASVIGFILLVVLVATSGM